MSARTVENTVRESRDRAGLSQQALAERAGVTRQAIIAIEAGRQVPSTALALQLARALGARVDELFRLGDPEAIEVLLAPGELRPAVGEATQATGRVAIGRVGERWVAHPLPADEAMGADGTLLDRTPDVDTARGRVQPVVDPDALADRTLVAGCAPLLALLSHRLSTRFRDTEMRWLPATSHRALDLLEAGLVHVAGIHLSDRDSQGANRAAVERRFLNRGMLVVNLTLWRQGLVVPEGNPDGIRGVSDLLRPGLRFVGRDAGAGATQLVARLLKEEGTEAAPQVVGVASGHDEVARYVQFGAADAGIAIEGVAVPRNLGFVPLAEERFDLVVPADLAEAEPVRRILDVLDDPGFREEIGRFPGYDGSLSGHVTEVGG